MPISPENAARYPRDWPEISRRLRFERAGSRCECHGDHGADQVEAAARYGDYPLGEQLAGIAARIRAELGEGTHGQSAD